MIMHRYNFRHFSVLFTSMNLVFLAANWMAIVVIGDEGDDFTVPYLYKGLGEYKNWIIQHENTFKPTDANQTELKGMETNQPKVQTELKAMETNQPKVQGANFTDSENTPRKPLHYSLVGLTIIIVTPQR